MRSAIFESVTFFGLVVDPTGFFGPGGRSALPFCRSIQDMGLWSLIDGVTRWQANRANEKQTAQYQAD
jgi:hypothetical protein